MRDRHRGCHDAATRCGPTRLPARWPRALRPGAPQGGATFAASPGVAPEDAVLLLDEVPAQDDVLPPLRVLSAHSAGERGAVSVPTVPPRPQGLQGHPAWYLWETLKAHGRHRTRPNAAGPGRAAWPGGRQRGPGEHGQAAPQPHRPTPDAPPGEPILDVVQEALRHQRVLVQVDKMRRLGGIGGSPLLQGAGAQHRLPAWPLSPWAPDHHRPEPRLAGDTVSSWPGREDRRCEGKGSLRRSL